MKFDYRITIAVVLLIITVNFVQCKNVERLSDNSGNDKMIYRQREGRYRKTGVRNPLRLLGRSISKKVQQVSTVEEHKPRTFDDPSLFVAAKLWTLSKLLPYAASMWKSHETELLEQYRKQNYPTPYHPAPNKPIPYQAPYYYPQLDSHPSYPVHNSEYKPYPEYYPPYPYGYHSYYNQPNYPAHYGYPHANAIDMEQGRDSNETFLSDETDDVKPPVSIIIYKIKPSLPQKNVLLKNKKKRRKNNQNQKRRTYRY